MDNLMLYFLCDADTMSRQYSESLKVEDLDPDELEAERRQIRRRILNSLDGGEKIDLDEIIDYICKVRIMGVLTAAIPKA